MPIKRQFTYHTDDKANGFFFIKIVNMLRTICLICVLAV
jgi:hypothetical protein